MGENDSKVDTYLRKDPFEVVEKDNLLIFFNEKKPQINLKWKRKNLKLY